MARVAFRFGLGSIVAVAMVAGLIFAAFEMLAAAILMGPDAAMTPLRMIGAIALGAEALEPGYSVMVAAAAVLGTCVRVRHRCGFGCSAARDQ